jgi:hypothetical protein
MPVRDRTFPCEDTLDTAAVAQKLGGGSNTFAVAPDWVVIRHADKACYIASTEAALASAADGENGDRVYVAEGAKDEKIRWDGESQDLYFINVTGGETPFLAVVGLVGEE